MCFHYMWFLLLLKLSLCCQVGHELQMRQVKGKILELIHHNVALIDSSRLCSKGPPRSARVL
ncbi:uncharacterized protein DS421_11g337050 [Arachis hypogaea]|nr:uncharacterized protein DS421_11g337050 [Arachis hypogaea]